MLTYNLLCVSSTIYLLQEVKCASVCDEPCLGICRECKLPEMKKRLGRWSPPYTVEDDERWLQLYDCKCAIPVS